MTARPPSMDTTSSSSAGTGPSYGLTQERRLQGQGVEALPGDLSEAAERLGELGRSGNLSACLLGAGLSQPAGPAELEGIDQETEQGFKGLQRPG